MAVRTKVALLTRIVDSTISESFRDMDIDVFISLQQLSEAVSVRAIKVDKLVIVADVVQDAPTVALNMLAEILNNTFFRTTDIIYIAPPGAAELILIEYMRGENKLPEIDCKLQDVTREHIMTVIRGAQSTGGIVTQREVVRERRSDVQKAHIKSLAAPTHLDGDNVTTEEDRLHTLRQHIEVVFTPAEVLENRARLIQITGGKERGKTVFSVLLAQYIANTHRVILLESDFRYFSLSTYLRYSELNFTEIPVELVYDDPKSVIRAVRNSSENLICFTGISGTASRRLNRVFIQKFVYNLFSTHVDYILIESTLEEMLPAIHSVMVVNNDLISILRDVQSIPYNLNNVRFVALARSTIANLQIETSAEVTSLLSQLLNTELEPVPIYQLTSTRLGRDVYDLGGLLR